MKPPTQPLMKNLRQGTSRTQKAMVRIMRTTSYPSPKQLPSIALRRSPQKLDMLYNYNWQHMQPLARLKAKARVSPRKARVKARARLFVLTRP